MRARDPRSSTERLCARALIDATWSANSVSGRGVTEATEKRGRLKEHRPRSCPRLRCVLNLGVGVYASRVRLLRRSRLPVPLLLLLFPRTSLLRFSWVVHGHRASCITNAGFASRGELFDEPSMRRDGYACGRRSETAAIRAAVLASNVRVATRRPRSTSRAIRVERPDSSSTTADARASSARFSYGRPA